MMTTTILRPTLGIGRATLAALAALAALAVGTGAAHAAPAPWQSLLRSDSAPAWRGWTSPGLPPGWHVAGGVLSKDGPVEDLVTTRDYRDFELQLQWKIGEAGNSGIFYRGTHRYDHIYWSAPEYQLLDDANAPDGRSRLTAAAADYALYGAPAGVVRPFGHWNSTRIVVRGRHVEHWLNGRKVVDYTLGSADWTRRVAASKFSAYPQYGLATTGMIGIQGDHPGALAIRGIRIRELR
jgi:3-keto-disaccharide hydrolase